MNDRDLRSKKQSVTSIKNYDKNINSSQTKIGPVQPKQPPNISNYYQAKNKQGYSKQIRTQPFKQAYQTQKVRSKIVIPNRSSRQSNSKKQQEYQIKKVKHDTNKVPHHISKVHKTKNNNKMISKQNKQSSSNFDIEQTRKQKQKMLKTQVFQCKLGINSVHQLTCKQKILKLPKSIKPKSMDLNFHSQTKAISQHIVAKKTFAQEIQQFQHLNAKIQISSQSQTLSQLFKKQQAYSRIQHYNCYLNKKQPYVTWTIRAYVMNWMIIFLSQMGSRRQAYGLAVNYIDRYLALTCNIPQQKLQTIACSAMLIANKIDGIAIPYQNFRIPGLSFTQILQYQNQIYKILKWKLNPPTLNMWSNRIIQHWDLYLQHHMNILPCLLIDNIGLIKFKDNNYESCYMNFRTLMQYIDYVLLDVQTLQYHNRQIAASFLYIILNNNLCIYNFQQICHKFPHSSQYLFKQNQLNQFYSQFLQHSFGFCLQDLLPTIQYCSTFVNLELDYSLPVGIQDNNDKQIPYSQFCSKLTCNPNNLECVTNRNREFN